MAVSFLDPRTIFLQQEAEWFWQRHSDDPESHIPDTFNMMGYLVPKGANETVLPESLRGLAACLNRQ